MFGRREFLAGLAGAAAAPAFAARSDLDIAYVNARVWTGRSASAFSDALGTSGSRIAAIGRQAVRARTGPKTRVIDLGGAFVTPGFVDSHTHFLRASLMIAEPSLKDANSRAEFIQRIAEAAKRLPPGEWLQGGYWDTDRWGGELPSRTWIDAVTPNTPVAVIRYDLHMLLLNSVALKLAGIDRNTADVPGGVIERDSRGEPTGVLKDEAKELAIRAIPKPSAARQESAIREGIALGLSKGVTQIHTPELDWDTHDTLRRLRARGESGIRFYSFVPLKDWEKLAALVREQGRGDDWVRWGGCKVVYDGSLGSRTALFYEPYLDDPSTRGIRVTKLDDLRAWMIAADRAGMHVTGHAIGDQANDEMLDVMAEVEKRNGRRDRRFRVEHAQHLSPRAIARFARQRVIASVQPYHAIDDGRWAIKRIGPERLKRTYAFRSLLASGARVTLGSDWPVAPLDPLTGVEAAVVRETLDGQNPGGWHPEQRITLAQTLGGYTREGAYAGFMDQKTGMLAPGYLADFVVFDSDLFKIDPKRITSAKVLRTIVGGVQRFG
jgi:hypothetical protein